MRNDTLSSRIRSFFSGKPVAPEVNFPPAGTSPDELFQGRVELEVTAPQKYDQVQRLQAYITRIPDLRLVSAGGSAQGNVTMVVVCDRPLPLLSLLDDIPLTKDVVKTERNIRIALETLHFA